LRTRLRPVKVVAISVTLSLTSLAPEAVPDPLGDQTSALPSRRQGKPLNGRRAPRPGTGRGALGNQPKLAEADIT